MIQVVFQQPFILRDVDVISVFAGRTRLGPILSTWTAVNSTPVPHTIQGPVLSPMGYDAITLTYRTAAPALDLNFQGSFSVVDSAHWMHVVAPAAGAILQEDAHVGLRWEIISSPPAFVRLTLLKEPLPGAISIETAVITHHSVNNGSFAWTVAVPPDNYRLLIRSSNSTYVSFAVGPVFTVKSRGIEAWVFWVIGLVVFLILLALAGIYWLARVGRIKLPGLLAKLYVAPPVLPPEPTTVCVRDADVVAEDGESRGLLSSAAKARGLSAFEIHDTMDAAHDNL